MMNGSSYTPLGLAFGWAAGIPLSPLTQQVWWFGLVGVGLVLGAGMDSARRKGG